jgi:hypothetical protein
MRSSRRREMIADIYYLMTSAYVDTITGAHGVAPYL